MSDHDEETQRALAELEATAQAAAAERTELETRATAAGVKFSAKLSTDKLRERVEAAEAEYWAGAVAHQQHAKDGTLKVLPATVITNPGRNVRRMGPIVIAPGGSHTLTDRELADERTMAKINHMVKLGVLHRGAD